jgi:hypothetical protein
MDKTQELRKNAENCAELANNAATGPAKKRFLRMADGWNVVAENQAWLDGQADAAVDGRTDDARAP